MGRHTRFPHHLPCETMSFSALCDCCCRRQRNSDSQHSQEDEITSRDTPSLKRDEPVTISLNAPTAHRTSSLLLTETPGQTANRLRGELDSMRQQKDDEQTSQQQSIASSSTQHRHRMDEMKSGHATEMAQMRQSKLKDTTTCNATMASMNARTEQEMTRRTADHNANVKAMRSRNDGADVKHNERMNVLKLEQRQRTTNYQQRLDAQCSDLKQKQRTEEMMHSQRMKVLSFSHIGVASDARNRNAMDLEAQRADVDDKKHCQQNKVDAANARHHQNIDDEKVRHGQEMSDQQTASDAKTAVHNAKMGRMGGKNKHKTEDANHMALQFVKLENSLKQSQERCAVHEQKLTENAQRIKQTQIRRDLLVAQSEVVRAVKEAIAKDRSKQSASAVKRKKFKGDAEEIRFLRDQIEYARTTNTAFEEEMVVFVRMMGELNEQIRKTC